MGSLRPLTVQAERHLLLRWRARRNRDTVIAYLDLLAVAVQAKGYKTIKLYQAHDLPAAPPILWVMAFSPRDHVRAAITVHAAPGKTWAYHQAGHDRRGHLVPCGDTKHAADQVDALLKHLMFPATWPAPA